MIVRVRLGNSHFEGTKYQWWKDDILGKAKERQKQTILANRAIFMLLILLFVDWRLSMVDRKRDRKRDQNSRAHINSNVLWVQ